MIAHAGNLPEPARDDEDGALVKRPVQVPALPRMYWSLVPAPGSVRPGPIPLGVAQDVQADIPIDLSELHAVGVPTRAGEPRLLVCAARRTDLRTYLDGPDALYPADVPEFAQGLGVSASEFNLLVGDFLPRPLRRRAERRHLAAAAAVLACVAMLWVGMHRRESAARQRTAAAVEQQRQMLAGLDPGLASTDALQLRVNLLNQLKFALDAAPQASDAAETLAGVLAAWPVSAAPSPEAVGVQPSVVTASFSVEGDVSGALDALTNAQWPAGWSLQPPQLAKAGDRTRVAVELRKARQPASAQGVHQ
jgi:hypothetical protein